jgi:hypothetical protein
MSTSQTNFAFLHETPAAPSGFRNTYPQIGGTDPAYISNYYDSIGNVSARTTTTETIAVADQGKLITFANASTVTATLDSTVPVNFVADILNNGPGVLDLTPNGGLLISMGNAAATSTGSVSSGTFGRLFRNETQWYFGFGGTGVAQRMRLVASTSGQPNASQVIPITVADAATFPANFSSPNSYGSVGTNPSASVTVTIKKNGTAVGTAVISTGGVFTFATSGGTSWATTAGDRVTFEFPSVADATLSNVSIVIAATLN